MKKILFFILLVVLFSFPNMVYAQEPKYSEREVFVIIEAPLFSDYPTMDAYSQALLDQAEAFASRFGLKVTKVYPEITRSSGNNVMLLRSEHKSTETLIDELSSVPYVLSVTPNYITTVPDVFGPIAPAIVNIAVGETQQLIVVGTSKSHTWFSSNTAIATVDASGLVTGISTGVAIITAMTEDEQIATRIVTVSPTLIPATSITIEPKTASIFVSKTKLLFAVIEPVDASTSDITWSSNNQAIVTVNSSGLITGVSTGTATITVRTGDILTATCKVAVVKDDRSSSAGGGCSTIVYGIFGFVLMFTLIVNARNFSKAKN